MGSVVRTDVCPICGTEYTVEMTTTGEYRIIEPCKCSKIIQEAFNFIKEKGLWNEFIDVTAKKYRESPEDVEELISKL